MDWSRKHLVDLSGLCKDCEEDPTLPVTHRNAFAETYLLTKQFSSLPHGGGAGNVATVIAQLCDACRGSFCLECGGRSVWHQPCPLLIERMYRQMR